jgi:hypothetical protein
VDSVRVALPLFQTEGSGASPTSTLQLSFYRCTSEFAATLNKQWHSRLPEYPQAATVSFAFRADFNGIAYAVAIWSRPIARMLPQTWYELRRYAIAPDAPKNTASRFLAWMTRYIKREHPECKKLISYQDISVHKGTIYKACGWTNKGKTHQSGKVGWNNRVRFRKEINGREVLESVKHRWELDL